MLIKNLVEKSVFEINEDKIAFVLPRGAHPVRHIFEALCAAANIDPNGDEGKLLWAANDFKVSASLAFSEEDIESILGDFESLTRRDELLWDLEKKGSLIQYDVESDDDDEMSEVSFYNHLGGGTFQLSTNIGLNADVEDTLECQGPDGGRVILEMTSQIGSKMAEENISAMTQFQVATILNGLLERPLLTLTSTLSL